MTKHEAKIRGEIFFHGFVTQYFARLSVELLARSSPQTLWKTTTKKLPHNGQLVLTDRLRFCLFHSHLIVIYQWHTCDLCLPLSLFVCICVGNRWKRWSKIFGKCSLATSMTSPGWTRRPRKQRRRRYWLQFNVCCCVLHRIVIFGICGDFGVLFIECPLLLSAGPSYSGTNRLLWQHYGWQIPQQWVQRCVCLIKMRLWKFFLFKKNPINVTDDNVDSLLPQISSMKTYQCILGFYEICWRKYDRVLIALITTNPPASLAVCWC